MTDIKRKLKTIIKMIDERIESIDKQIDETNICLIPDTIVGERWGLSYAKGLVLSELEYVEIEEELFEDD